MKKLNFNLALGGAVFVIAVGTVLHFTYEWSHSNVVVGVLTPVNESVWEHLKLAFFPLCVWGIVEFLLLRKRSGNFFYVKAVEFYLVCFSIMASFYLYVGIIGRNYLPADIATFILPVIFGKIVSYRLLRKENKKRAVVPAVLLLLLAAMFVAFTFKPPRIALFRDSRDSTYGIYKKL